MRPISHLLLCSVAASSPGGCSFPWTCIRSQHVAAVTQRVLATYSASPSTSSVTGLSFCSRMPLTNAVAEVINRLYSNLSWEFSLQCLLDRTAPDGSRTFRLSVSHAGHTALFGLRPDICSLLRSGGSTAR